MELRYRSFIVVLALVVNNNFPSSSQFTSGDRQKIISTPDKLTKVFIGENVSLTWRYYQPTHLTLRHVLFGIFKRPGYMKTELAEVNKNGVPRVGKDYGISLSWAGNVTACLAVFVLYNVQPADGSKTFGIQVDFGYEYDMLTDVVGLQVDAKLGTTTNSTVTPSLKPDPDAGTPTNSSTVTPRLKPHPNARKLEMGQIVGMVLGVILVALILTALFKYRCKKKKSNREEKDRVVDRVSITVMGVGKGKGNQETTI